jgi:hypothetical protein
MEGLIFALVMMTVLCCLAIAYEQYSVKKTLEEIYVGRMVGFFEDGYVFNGAVVSYNDKEVVVSTLEGMYKTTINNIYFVD